MIGHVYIPGSKQDNRVDFTTPTPAYEAETTPTLKPTRIAALVDQLLG